MELKKILLGMTSGRCWKICASGRAVVCVGRIGLFALICGVPVTPPNAYFPDSSDKYLKGLYDRRAAETI